MTNVVAHRRTVALATCSSLPAGSPDEAIIARALLERGIGSRVFPWDDRSVRWTDCDAVLIRSTWDYAERLDEFTDWLNRLETARVRVLNPLPVLRANLRKDYLRELESRGVPIVPSIWVDPPCTDLWDSVPWDEVVVKPRVGAGGRATFRARKGEPRARHGIHWNVIDASGGALIQPFLREIETRGEWSLLFFAGGYSHAVLKRPAPSEFRIQESFGGRAVAADPVPALVDFARRVVQISDALRPEPSLYARVDIIETESGPRLGELEQLEPSLFFEQCPAGAARFADALTQRLG